MGLIDERTIYNTLSVIINHNAPGAEHKRCKVCISDSVCCLRLHEDDVVAYVIYGSPLQALGLQIGGQLFIRYLRVPSGIV